MTAQEAPELELGVDIVELPGGAYILREDFNRAERDGALLTDTTPEGEPILPIVGREQYRELLTAVLALEAPTPCYDDWRFIAEPGDLTHADAVAAMNACDRCPVRDLCKAYARVARPEAGIWAGMRYSPRTAQA